MKEKKLFSQWWTGFSYVATLTLKDQTKKNWLFNLF